MSVYIYKGREVYIPEAGRSGTEITKVASRSQHTTSEPNTLGHTDTHEDLQTPSPSTLPTLRREAQVDTSHTQTHAADTFGYPAPSNTQVAIPTVATPPPNSSTNVYTDLTANNLVFPRPQPDTPQHPDTSHTQLLPPTTPTLRPTPDWDTLIPLTHPDIDLATRDFASPPYSLSYIMPEDTTDDNNTDGMSFMSPHVSGGTTVDIDTHTSTPTSAGPSNLNEDTTTDTPDSEIMRPTSSLLTEGTTIDKPTSAQTRTQAGAHE